METTFVGTDELECKVRSKKDLYDLFKFNSKCQALTNSSCIPLNLICSLNAF